MNEDFEGFVMLWLDFYCTPEQREEKKLQMHDYPSRRLLSWEKKCGQTLISFI